MTLILPQRGRIRQPAAGGGGYTETLVSNAGTRYLSRGSGLTGAADSKTGLFFFSGSHSDTTFTHYLMQGADSISNRITRDNSSFYRTTWLNSSGSNSINFVGSTNSTTNRVAVLISIDADGTSHRYVWVDGSGWASDGIDGSGGGVNMDWTQSGWTLLNRASGAEPFRGNTARIAMWQGITLPDITSSTVRDNFINSSTGVTVDPATSVSAYGTPIIDFYGDATVWEAGTNQGSGGDFTASGSGVFSNV